MATIIIPAFKGMEPRTDKRLLNISQAVTAVNCKFERGSLQPRRLPRTVQPVAGSSLKSIYKHTSGWLSWQSAVNVNRSVVAGNIGHIFITGDGAPKQKSGGVDYPLGVPAPTVAPQLQLGGSAGDDTARSSSYVYTYVRDLGINGEQESAPSPPSGVLDVPEGQYVMLSGMSAPAGNGITHIRIYRSVAGESSSNFYFVTEILSNMTSYTDFDEDAAISSETLQTESWSAPPSDATGMVYSDNGIFAMHRTNEVLLSEPFVPYAYPDEYKLSVDDAIVGLGHIDSSIVVCTKSRPYMITGSTPESMSTARLGIEQSCVSARSIVSVPGAVLYASPDGIVRVSMGDQDVVSKRLYTKQQWQSLNPETIVATFYEDKYIAFFAGTGSGIVIDFSTGDVTTTTMPDGVAVSGLYHSSEDDALYLLCYENGAYSVRQWDDQDAVASQYIWQTGEIFTSTQTMPAVVRVEGEHSHAAPLSFFLYAGGALRHSFQVTDAEPIRLPLLRKEKAWSIRISGTTDVYEIRVGSSIEELENGA